MPVGTEHWPLADVLSLLTREVFINFAVQNTCRAQERVMRVGCRHFEKTFISVSVLDQLKSGSFKIIVKTNAMVDVHGYVYIAPVAMLRIIIAIGVYLHIHVGSAHCSSNCDGHMPEPQLVGRAMVRYPRF